MDCASFQPFSKWNMWCSSIKSFNSAGISFQFRLEDLQDWETPYIQIVVLLIILTMKDPVSSCECSNGGFLLDRLNLGLSGFPGFPDIRDEQNGHSNILQWCALKVYWSIFTLHFSHFIFFYVYQLVLPIFMMMKLLKHHVPFL